MGALRDYVARDPRTEMPAVVNFPVLADNPYKADVPALLDLIEQERPELIILGKSMVLHPEPVDEVRTLPRRGRPRRRAHVRHGARAGPRRPALPAAVRRGRRHRHRVDAQDVLRHAARHHRRAAWQEPDERYDLWEAIERRTFPGSVSNHHLGTLVGLLMAAYEMNHFKDAYQRAVIANAKAFAVALKDAGLDVAGDPAVDYTETHQVVLRVGYGKGPEIAGRLEENNIICNYQAAPDEEGFTAVGRPPPGRRRDDAVRHGAGPTSPRSPP